MLDDATTYDVADYDEFLLHGLRCSPSSASELSWNFEAVFSGNNIIHWGSPKSGKFRGGAALPEHGPRNLDAVSGCPSERSTPYQPFPSYHP